jgi:hypothetical protein
MISNPLSLQVALFESRTECWVLFLEGLQAAKMDAAYGRGSHVTSTPKA